MGSPSGPRGNVSRQGARSAELRGDTAGATSQDNAHLPTNVTTPASRGKNPSAWSHLPLGQASGCRRGGQLSAWSPRPGSGRSPSIPGSTHTP